MHTIAWTQQWVSELSSCSLQCAATPPPERPSLPAAWLPDVEAAVAAYEDTWAAGAEARGAAQPPDDSLLQVGAP